ncbi:YsnF/AvaK domain-containing protein [Noviherbaspirillum saxi]|uniref:DUF2382 domain-containing protein n=1 Tax=Noviherbaspirillum saxi TaxID=2320863 RepID=A0A3A3G4X8_9BURK|nr:YsnF/AvaK domain-containing protein [Noviherbaspirillum saxi]RJF97185.1 DUF2382 domain-containing protein [Noviherbaspirillum saxi]
MENTIVGVYDSYAQAQNALNELLGSGFSRSDVQLSPDAESSAGISDVSTAGSGGSGIGNFFRSLFGMDEHREHGDIYSEAVRRGSCVLTVNAASDEQRDRAMEIMNRFDPVDIDERSSHWRSQGWSGYDESAPMYTDSEIEKDRALYGQSRTAATGSATTPTTSAMGSTDTQDLRNAETGTTRIPVVEEALQVGKREVQRGGVRLYQRVSETPVNESVQLREEHVHVERHPVDQPATAADLDAIKEGAVEMREMAEEPVISKTARVVEEVEIGKDVTQRTVDINETVRRTDVEVEQLAAASTRGMTGRDDYRDSAMTADDSDYRTHWQNAYGQSGERYEDYDAAYRYGSTMAGTERYKNYRWEDAEPSMRSDWESNHPESTWEKVKDAVRYGAERVTGRR